MPTTPGSIRVDKARKKRAAATQVDAGGGVVLSGDMFAKHKDGSVWSWNYQQGWQRIA